MSANLSNVIDELQQYGVPEDRACEIAAALIDAGARCVYAQLGEMCGRYESTQRDLAAIMACLIAQE